jgi:hypothetical protein
MKGVRVIPGTRVTSVVIDSETWPLPEIELLDRLTHGPRDDEDCLAAARVVRAYVQLVFDPAHKRQRVIAALRSARPKPARRALGEETGP